VKRVVVLLQNHQSFIYFRVLTKPQLLNPLKSTAMKPQVYQKKTVLSVFFSNLSKNFSGLFKSGDKKEFQRLKDFISS